MVDITDPFVHPSAFLDKGANIGIGSKIWHGTHIMGTATVGKNCTIGQNCFIAGQIGDDCKIQNNAQIFNGVIIGPDVFIGPNVCFTNILRPRAFINQKDAFQVTFVENGVSIGAGVTVVPGVVIREYAFVGAGSVVTKDVSPYALVFGNPAKVMGWVCKNGHEIQFRNFECKLCNA